MSDISFSAELHRLFDNDLPGLADPEFVELSCFSVGYRPHERLLVSDWSDDNRKLAGTAASEPGDWSTARTPYLREPMDNMSAKSPVWKQSLMAAAQIGKTEGANNCIGYWIASAPGPIMMVLPKTAVCEKVSKTRITPMINHSEAIASKVVENRLLMKEFYGGFLMFASAQSAKDLSSQPVQYIYCDEIDRFPLDVEGEGPALQLALARTTTFKQKRKVYYTSTPTTEAKSAIYAEYLAGDWRKYFMPCPGTCGEMITFEFEQLKWTPGKFKTVYYECPHCQAEIKEYQKTKMMAAGVWKPTRPDLENVEEGVRSYHISGLYSPVGWLGWDEIAREWEEAHTPPINQRAIAAFYNIRLGLPSKENTEEADWETVWNRGSAGDPYKMVNGKTIIPDGVLLATGGIDFGKDHIAVGVWGFGKDRKRWWIDHYRIEGDPHDPAVLDQLTDHISTPYLNKHDVEMRVWPYLADTGYLPDIVIPWLKKQNPKLVMGCDGLDDRDVPVKVKIKAEPTAWDPSKTTNVGAVRVVQVDVSYYKSELLGALNVPIPSNDDGQTPVGFLHAPLQAEDFSRDLCKQLTSERKIVELDENKVELDSRWERISGRRAEGLDCHNYARAGANLRGWDRMTEIHFDKMQAQLDDAAQYVRELREAEERGAPIMKTEKQTTIQITPPGQKPVVITPGNGSQSNTTPIIVGETGRKRPVVPMPVAMGDGYD